MKPKKLRALIMSNLSYSDDYVKVAMLSKGINPAELTHNEAVLFKAYLRQIEADVIIEVAKDKTKTSTNDIPKDKLMGRG